MANRGSAFMNSITSHQLVQTASKVNSTVFNAKQAPFSESLSALTSFLFPSNGEGGI